MADNDWVHRLFQGAESTRGLSGASGDAVALGDANAFYNYRLRRNATSADVVQHPIRLWNTGGDAGQRAGLGVHAAEVMAEDRPFTDALIVLSAADHDAAMAIDPAFGETVTRVIGDAFDDLRVRSGAGVSARRLGIWLVRDGDDEIGGTSFGLARGEFITGILPNLYRRPGAASRPMVSLHVNLPGAWEGYREVGTLYDDQILFTLGSHWLDNFSHPSLREPALFSLRIDEGGSVMSILHPDVAAGYQVHTTDQGGFRVLTLATVDGEPLAHVVLVTAGVGAMAEPEIEELDELDITDLGPDDVELEPLPKRSTKTILPEAHKERIFTLQERGALLQKVHFSAFMLGYDVYFGHRGDVGTVVRDVAATFQVRKRSVSLLANVPGITLNGELVPAGEARLIEGDAVIEVGTQRIEYHDLRHVEIDGWPYVGEIRRPASSTYMLWGRDYVVGRSRECRVVLPDEPMNANIVWKASVGDGSTIRTKNGEIPKARFYTDSIMVASEHAVIELAGEQPAIACRAKECFSFIRRHGEMLTLHPTASGRQPTRLPLEPGDELLVGNCLFHVGFASAGARAVQPAPAPAARLSADSIIAAVSAPDLGELDAPAPTAFAPSDEHPLASAVGFLPDLGDEDELPPPPKVEQRPRPPSRSLADVPDLEGPPPQLTVADAITQPPSEPDEERTDPDIEQDDPHEMTTALPASLLRAIRSGQVPPDESTTVFIDARRPEPAPPAPAPPEPAPPAPAPPAPPVPVGSVGAVVVVTDQDARFEIGRPARLVHEGWMINGEVACGNHPGADLVLAENQVRPDQQFAPRTYFRLRVRGRRGQIDVLDPDEVRVTGVGPTGEIDQLRVEVIRRDDWGEEDFALQLALLDEPNLPDPRARLLQLDTSDPLALALVVRGLPLRAPRTLDLGGVHATALFDGERVRLGDYLATYRDGDRYRSFFVQQAGARFRTAPEDGSEIVLAPGDRVIVGTTVWRVDVA